MHWLRPLLIGLLIFVPVSPSPFKHVIVSMSSSTATPSQHSTLRILALHGSGGDAKSFRETINRWNRALPKKMNSHFDIVTINAPVENNQQGGYSWWQLPTGIRSFQAETYEEFDESKQRFTDAMNSSNKPFDFIVGHSQGAIFLTSLLAQNMISHHPTGGYIMNGVAWPNPYTRQLESLKDTIFTSGRGPRVLLIIGEGDKINPPEQAMRVQLALEAAGYPVQTIHHPGGHSVPVKSSKTLELIMDWIQASMVQEQLKSLL